jgi:hypothetical protein
MTNNIGNMCINMIALNVMCSHHRYTDVVSWEMQIHIMDSQYESVNVTDYDVVRSKQFPDDFTHQVCPHPFLSYRLQSIDANPHSHSGQHATMCHICTTLESRAPGFLTGSLNFFPS